MNVANTTFTTAFQRNKTLNNNLRCLYHNSKFNYTTSTATLLHNIIKSRVQQVLLVLFLQHINTMFFDISRVNVQAVKYRNIHYKWLTLRLVFGFVLMAHLVSVSEISYHPGNVARQFILHNHQFNKQKRSSLKITLLHTN